MDQKMVHYDGRSLTFLQHSSKIYCVYNFSGIFKNLSNDTGPQTAFPYTTVGQTSIYGSGPHTNVYFLSLLWISISILTAYLVIQYYGS